MLPHRGVCKAWWRDRAWIQPPRPCWPDALLQGPPAQCEKAAPRMKRPEESSRNRLIWFEKEKYFLPPTMPAVFLFTRVLLSNLYIITTLTFEVGIEPRTAEYSLFFYFFFFFFGMRKALRQTLNLTSCYTYLLSICSFHSAASLPADIVLNASSSPLLSAVAYGLGERNGCHSMV